MHDVIINQRGLSTFLKLLINVINSGLLSHNTNKLLFISVVFSYSINQFIKLVGIFATSDNGFINLYGL